MKEWIALIFTICTGVASTIIAIQLYRLSDRQQKESWLRAFQDIHREFWSDATMAEIRACLANDTSYNKIKPTLLKRIDIDERIQEQDSLSASEYEDIEKLDKFLNFLLRILAVQSLVKYQGKKELWQRLFADYWLKKFLTEERQELLWYVGRFYPELIPNELDSVRSRAYSDFQFLMCGKRPNLRMQQRPRRKLLILF